MLLGGVDMIFNRLYLGFVVSLIVGGLAQNGFADTTPKQVSIDCKFVSINTDPIEIGANMEVGSGAELANNAKNKAMGSLLGGSSSFGMGSSGGKSGGIGSMFGNSGGDAEGPETGSDPTTGAFTDGRSGGIDFSLRANIGPGNKLTLSLKLNDVPGDGTFHSQWLQDSDGNVHLPTKYIIITLYRDWSLTVSWTYDRYVDGQHVEHREGGWSESGRDTLASIRLDFTGEKGRENAIWNRLGFDTATKGVSHLVTQYDLPSVVTNGACPVLMKNFVSMPDEDPVTAVPLLSEIPVLGSLFRNKSERDQNQNLHVFVTPRILRTPEH